MMNVDLGLNKLIALMTSTADFFILLQILILLRSKLCKNIIGEIDTR